jgi:osmotically-inducible protein OsmY
VADRFTQSQAPIADLDIREYVEATIHDLDIVRESDVLLALSVNDGVVTVGGNILTRTMRRAIVQAAAMVPSVQKVIDNLYVDSDITIAVSQALAVHPDTRAFQAEIAVRSYRGEVTLSGKLPNAEAIQAASEVAAKTPGVLAVVNRLTLEE